MSRRGRAKHIIGPPLHSEYGRVVNYNYCSVYSGVPKWCLARGSVLALGLRDVAAKRCGTNEHAIAQHVHHPTCLGHQIHAIPSEDAHLIAVQAFEDFAVMRHAKWYSSLIMHGKASVSPVVIHHLLTRGSTVVLGKP